MDQALIEFFKEQSYQKNDLEQFELALNFIQFLKNEKRIKKEDNFYLHNLRVAKIIATNKSMPKVVMVGLLHGISDKNKLKEIKIKFGDEIFNLVKGVEEIKNIKHQNKSLEAEALRKILLTTFEDVRVILVKLADKLDNLQSVKVLSEKDQKKIAIEILEIYAPLAYRLGLDKWKIQLENLAFEIINPEDYQKISVFLKTSQEEREKDVKIVIEKIKDVAKDKLEIISIKGRPKHIYSIYKKIKSKKKELKDLHDLIGIRIIVAKDKDCYHLLGLLHEMFEPIEGRLKDYITNPKPNLYRSIHTGLKFPNGKIVEVQIRTPEMDEFAEEGIAAHWRYKKLSSEESFEKKVSWLRSILDLKKDIRNKEFLETAKIDIFGDLIYCYTPKGDVKELPKGSTILDFAFLIHEQVGATTVGGRINGKFVPLRAELSQGDIVEIVTNKNQRPRRTWIKIVRSGKARQKIRKYLKQHENLPALHYHHLKPKIKEEQGILVESEEFTNALCLLAKCCSPIPGNEIVGIITKRKIVSVHRADCRFALKEEKRWVPVNWKETFNQKINFQVEAFERSGLLADLLNNIANVGFEVKEAKAKLKDINHAQCSFMIVPRDLCHLKELIKRVNKVKGVYRIYFE